MKAAVAVVVATDGELGQHVDQVIECQESMIFGQGRQLNGISQ